ncbi:MAG: hypothetical protein KDD22_04550 [Bdellovibrionales bacterium]|nr:hypothetical protein [Bdellovibrionales bacterium]
MTAQIHEAQEALHNGLKGSVKLSPGITPKGTLSATDSFIEEIKKGKVSSQGLEISNQDLSCGAMVSGKVSGF